VRQSPSSKGVNTEAEEAMALEAVTRQRLVKTQQTEKISCMIFNGSETGINPLPGYD
jgi:hypothetical protein